MRFVVALMSILSVHAMAAPTSFAERAPYASGAAVVQPAAGGEYIHAPATTDRRVRSAPLLVGTPERQIYTFFSAEEEMALLAYRDRQLASRLKERVIVQRKRHYRATGNLTWPKVVVRSDEICVPELASSDAVDWRDHLVCHRERTSP
jgi:hypothetical protein